MSSPESLSFGWKTGSRDGYEFHPQSGSYDNELRGPEGARRARPELNRSRLGFQRQHVRKVPAHSHHLRQVARGARYRVRPRTAGRGLRTPALGSTRVVRGVEGTDRVEPRDVLTLRASGAALGRGQGRRPLVGFVTRVNEDVGVKRPLEKNCMLSMPALSRLTAC